MELKKEDRYFMKHHVYVLLVFMNFLLCATVDKHAIVDKSQRIGRFNHEDSFDENLVEKILKYPVSVKKYIKNFLYPSEVDDNYYNMSLKRVLLLGGTNTTSTTAIAKTIALRCGYDYYMIEFSVLLRSHYEGQQRLLNEVLSVMKQGKPIALIITELPEMVDYSGLLISTLWMLIDKHPWQILTF